MFHSQTNQDTPNQIHLVRAYATNLNRIFFHRESFLTVCPLCAKFQAAYISRNPPNQGQRYKPFFERVPRSPSLEKARPPLCRPASARCTVAVAPAGSWRQD